MTDDERAEYLAMSERVFVRALRDPIGADTEFLLSEGQATDLVRRRERAAILAFLEAFDGEWGREEIDEIEDIDTTNADRARALLSALRAQAAPE